MKKFFLSLAVFVMALCANAQTNQYFWYQGNLMMGNPIALIDSVTFGEGEPADTLHILLPRTIIKAVHDTIYITIHDTVCPNFIPEGALAGEFSVSATKKVRFSKGNLQYQASTDIWRFAENQYDYIGEGNLNISPTYSGWIDLFGWGTGNNPTNTSSSDADYQTFVDWGINVISNGGNEADLWRSLSSDEWNYILNLRANAENLYGRATVNDIYGLVILPDNWSTPIDLNFVANTNNWTSNSYSTIDWEKMEANGAIFFSCAGARHGRFLTLHSDGTWGHYWLSNTVGDNSADLTFGQTNEDFDNVGNRCDGQSVRLVQDVE